MIVDNADGTSCTSPTCIVPAVRFNGKSIRTVHMGAEGNDAWGVARPQNQKFT